MKPITYQDRVKFEAIKETVLNHLIENEYSTFYIDYELLCDLVETAKRKNKLNNSLLKRNDFESVVSTYYLKDIKTNECNYSNVRANKNNSTKLLFIYEVLNSQFAPKQVFTHFKENVL